MIDIISLKLRLINFVYIFGDTRYFDATTSSSQPISLKLGTRGNFWPHISNIGW